MIGIDTMHNAEMQWPEAAAARVVAAFEADYDGSMRALLGNMIHPDADDAITDWVVAESLETNHAVAMALMNDFPHLDLRSMFRAIDVPIRCVNAKAGPGRGQPTRVEQNQQYGDDDDTDLADQGILLGAFNSSCRGDLDGDGDTDLSDLGILLAVYNICP